MEEIKSTLIDKIDNFIIERISYAQDAIVTNGDKILSDKREEVIMVYGTQESQIVEEILKHAHETKTIRVVVVDSAPDYQGRSMVKRLASYGIKC